MKFDNTRIPLVIALSSALAFAVGCSNHTPEDQAAMESADATTAEPAPVEPMTEADTHSADAAEGMLGDGRESDQPVDDTWITTKVKSSLLADTDVSGLTINVDTLNGVVTLKGEAEQQAQIDKAISIARGIEGVVDVQATELVTAPAQ